MRGVDHRRRHHGALVAERLTRQGRQVVIIDRELPSLGSTVASTAMLLWEIDRPLFDLAQLCGFEKAVRCYRASHQAAQGLLSLVAQHGIACQMRPRLSLYLAVDNSPKLVQDEYALRGRADLPSRYLDHAVLLKRFGIARAGALLSGDAADADPVLLTRGLLDISVQRRARLLKANAVAFDSAAQSVTVGLESGLSIEARHVVLATGYVVPDIVRSDPHWLLTLCALTLAMRGLESAILILPAIHGLLRAATAVMLIAAGVFLSLVFWLAFDAVLTRTPEENGPIVAIWPRTRGETEVRSTGQGQ